MKQFVLFLFVMVLVLPSCSPKNELDCFILGPDFEEMVDIYDAPGGEAIYQVEPYDTYQITAIVPREGDWWRIKDRSILNAEGWEEIEIPSKEAWIHRSLLAVATDYEDGQPRKLYAEPSRDAKRVMVIHEIRAILRPLALSADGKWVKVTYDPSEFEERPCEIVTGWIEKSKVRDDTFEPGDGGPVPIHRVSVPGKEDVICREKPGSGAQTLVLEKGKTYEFSVGNPKNGWWQLWDGYVEENDETKWVDDEAWMPAAALFNVVKDWSGVPTVPVYEKPDGKSRKLFDLKTGTLVHPTDFKDWEWIKVYVDGHPEQTGWIEWGKLSN